MMRSETELLRLLDDEPSSPSTVDIRRAIADGQRRRLRRGLGYAGAAALTVAVVAGVSVAAGRPVADPRPEVAATGGPRTTAVPKAKPAFTVPGTAGWTAAPATAPTSCTLSRLDAPDDAPEALASGADPTGRYVVGRSYPKGGGYQAVRWHDGAAAKVMLPGDLEESLEDVNSAGTAVGWSYDEGGPVPYVYRDGKVSKLAGPRHGSAVAVNAAGAIVGGTSTGPQPGGSALLWPSATAKAIRLPVPAGTRTATANDIDDDGTVVGNLDLKRPYAWFADGTARPLATPARNGRTATAARVFGIRNGWAVGVADAPGSTGARRASTDLWSVRWNLRTGEVRVFEDFGARAQAVNAQGWQIGTDKQGRAILLTGAGPVILPDLAGHDADGLADIPNAVSDDGRTVVGQADDTTGTIQAVVWRCH